MSTPSKKFKLDQYPKWDEPKISRIIGEIATLPPPSIHKVVTMTLSWIRDRRYRDHLISLLKGESSDEVALGDNPVSKKKKSPPALTGPPPEVKAKPDRVYPWSDQRYDGMEAAIWLRSASLEERKTPEGKEVLARFITLHSLSQRLLKFHDVNVIDHLNCWDRLTAVRDLTTGAIVHPSEIATKSEPQKYLDVVKAVLRGDVLDHPNMSLARGDSPSGEVSLRATNKERKKRRKSDVIQDESSSSSSSSSG